MSTYDILRVQHTFIVAAAHALIHAVSEWAAAW